MFRVTCNGVGVYQYLRSKVSIEEWKKLLEDPRINWLPTPLIYPDNARSCFTKAGLKKFEEVTLPLMMQYINEEILISSFNERDEINLEFTPFYWDEFQVIFS